MSSTCLTHLTVFGKEYKSWSSLLCSFLHPPVIFTLLGLNISLFTLFSDMLIACLTFMWEIKTKGKSNCCVYFNLLCFWAADRLKILDLPDRQHSWNLICLWFHHECNSYFCNSQIYGLFNVLNGLQAVFMIKVYPALCSLDINMYFVLFASGEYLVIFTFWSSQEQFQSQMHYSLLCVFIINYIHSAVDTVQWPV